MVQDGVPEAAALAMALERAGLTIAVAESCTGGLLGAVLTARPGASAWFRGGVIAYSNEVKTALLGVSTEVLERWGAVSEQAARQMADGVRARCGAGVGVAITGVAGPGADGSAKPAGLIHVAVAGPGSASRHRELSGDHGRADNRARAVRAALVICREAVEDGF